MSSTYHLTHHRNQIGVSHHSDALLFPLLNMMDEFGYTRMDDVV